MVSGWGEQGISDDARSYFSEQLASRWSQFPESQSALRGTAVHGTRLDVLTWASPIGEQRAKIAPLCLVADDFVQKAGGRLSSYRVLAIDGTAFRFDAGCSNGRVEWWFGS